MDKYHIDGLRVDAVASMLYLDYSRKSDEWVPNQYGGRENLEAIEFLKYLNSICQEKHPGVMNIAEESTAWPGVSKPCNEGGLGFTFKWNMGWMNDTLSYFQKDPIYRRYHHNNLTFPLIYAFHEYFIYVLSHDEVVHGKGNIINKMPGDFWQKFANVRLLFSMMWAMHGKKLLFMGTDFGQWNEWNSNQSLDWHLLEHAPHKGMQSLVRDLNRHYRTIPALHARDCEPEGFEWLIADDHENSVFAWARHSGDGGAMVAVIANFTPVPREGYVLPLPKGGVWREIVNSDASGYGGSGVGNLGQVVADAGPSHGKPASARVTLPPLATLFFISEP